jgi:hypothetical protein
VHDDVVPVFGHRQVAEVRLDHGRGLAVRVCGRDVPEVDDRITQDDDRRRLTRLDLLAADAGEIFVVRIVLEPGERVRRHHRGDLRRDLQRVRVGHVLPFPFLCQCAPAGARPQQPLLTCARHMPRFRRAVTRCRVARYSAGRRIDGSSTREAHVPQPDPFALHDRVVGQLKAGQGVPTAPTNGGERGSYSALRSEGLAPAGAPPLTPQGKFGPLIVRPGGGRGEALFVGFTWGLIRFLFLAVVYLVWFICSVAIRPFWHIMSAATGGGSWEEDRRGWR